mgnify:CR=1 FL=1
MENDSSGKAERENYETQNDCSTAFRNPHLLKALEMKEKKQTKNE